MSDLAVILPSGPNATATQMSGVVNATSEYPNTPVSLNSHTPLGPGTYTAAAGDEWGSITLVHFTIGPSASITTSAGAFGDPGAQLAVVSLALSAFPLAAVGLDARLRPRLG